MPNSVNHKPSPGMTGDSAHLQKLRIRMILLSFFVSLVLMGLKFLTYSMTLSSAVLSDALESIINVVASAFATISVWLAAKPPDPEHPYGHGKIEYFSAGFEGALIILAAAGIFYSGARQLMDPHDLPRLEQGVLILTGASVVNLLLGIGLVRVGRRTDSITLEADGKHIMTDVYSSAAVVVGLLLVQWTGWNRLDGAVACLVGVNILISGGQLMRQSFARLMDASDPVLLDRIAECLQSHRRPQWIDVHKLRAWRAGHLIHIDLHLVLPRDFSMDQAHDEAKDVEVLLLESFEGRASALVHVDPCDESMCPVCQRQSCRWRSNDMGPALPWNRNHLIRVASKYPVRPGNEPAAQDSTLDHLDNPGARK